MQMIVDTMAMFDQGSIICLGAKRHVQEVCWPGTDRALVRVVCSLLQANIMVLCKSGVGSRARGCTQQGHCLAGGPVQWP